MEQNLATETINTIYLHYKNKSDNGFRGHLGASIIGKPCERAIWYDFRWCTPSDLEGRLYRLFDTGHLAEDRFAADLQAIGVKLNTVNPQTGKQYQIQACDGFFGGSLDGIAMGFPENPTQKHVVEMKTHSDKSFKQLKKKGVKEAKPQHYTQMQMYMSASKIHNAFYIAVNKDTDELYGEFVEFDQDHADRHIEKAARIICSDKPLDKVSDNPSWYECKLCDHQAICHGNKAPAVNCRTCLHVGVETEGRWECKRYAVTLTEEQQQWGCQSHMYNPYLLVNFAEVLDAGDYWIKYVLKETGEIFISGEDPEQLSSSEIRAVDDKSLLTDSNVSTLREAFNAQLTEG
ncbi:oxidoreductase [Spartinivicinus ruber]|uniref:oxidoreductase n=1 Tax=Spartinivicinus ruber TaxID=2683272 RepID=UPI0015B5779D|nr:oxidoreductase [Spartinivicinus ruber]